MTSEWLSEDIDHEASMDAEEVDDLVARVVHPLALTYERTEDLGATFRHLMADLLRQFLGTHKSIRLLVKSREENLAALADAMSLAREQVEKVYAVALLLEDTEGWTLRYLKDDWRRHYERYLLDVDERSSLELHQAYLEGYAADSIEQERVQLGITEAEKEITPEDVLGWAQLYGLLASIPGDDTVSAYDGFVNLRVSGWGRRENVRRFAEAAGEVRTCLRIFEAVSADEEVDLDKLSSSAGALSPEILRPWDYREGEERSWLFRVLGRLVQARLNEYCYPQFSTYTIGGLSAGKFGLSWGFKNLLGAIWLHMAWLLEAEGERVRRCKLPGCLRVVQFEPGVPAADPGLRKNARGKYKTRVDRQFCKGRACKQKYNYRKKAGWPGYS